ncbi:MAG: hypothetical protein R3B37_17360 [Nitrospira sp.]|nr:hypothetical protein [Nitrospira sp.]
MKRKYKFDSRFLDDLNRVSWDTAFTYVAKAAVVIAARYSGGGDWSAASSGAGVCSEMIEMMKGAGVRTFRQHRAGMPVLGIIGKMMNTLQRRMFAVAGLLDPQSRRGR